MDFEKEYGAAREMIRAYERQLTEIGTAWSHPRWTAGGEVVLIGDFGRFGNPDTLVDEDGGVARRIARIDGMATTVDTDPGDNDEYEADDYVTYQFAECAALVRRGRLPTEMEKELAGGGRAS